MDVCLQLSSVDTGFMKLKNNHLASSFKKVSLVELYTWGFDWPWYANLGYRAGIHKVLAGVLVKPSLGEAQGFASPRKSNDLGRRTQGL